MGKIGDVASLGAVAVAAFIVWQLTQLKLPKLELPKLPQLELPKLPVFPSPGPQGGLSGLNGGNGGGDNDVVDSNDISDPDPVYVPVIIRTTPIIPTPTPTITIHPTVEPDILTGMISRKPGFYAQSQIGYLDAGGGVNV